MPYFQWNLALHYFSIVLLLQFGGVPIVRLGHFSHVRPLNTSLQEQFPVIWSHICGYELVVEQAHAETEIIKNYKDFHWKYSWWNYDGDFEELFRLQPVVVRLGRAFTNYVCKTRQVCGSKCPLFARSIEQCCWNSTPDLFDSQTANISKPPKVVESRTYVKKANLECYWNNTVLLLWRQHNRASLYVTISFKNVFAYF